MNNAMKQVMKKFELRKFYEDSTKSRISDNIQHYHEWLECQLILLMEKKGNGIKG